MKTKLATIISGWIALLILVSPAYAQAPSSLVGDGFLAGVSSGAYPLASSGYFLFIPANSGSGYQVIGIYNVINSSGTYTYTPTSASTATINANDSVGGALVLSASFSSASSGSFYETAISYPNAYQSGSFGFSSVNAPSSLAGRTFNCSVVNGASPFLTSGSYTITIANSGNTYTVSTGQSGTYSYSMLNRSGGMVQLNDSVTGVTTAYFGFSSATGGGFAIKASSGTGYQVGTFILLDTTSPTVAITAPTTGQNWYNSVFTVTGTASDNVQVAAVYYQVNSQGWNLASSADNWADWSASIGLLPGTNIIQAYSVDTSGYSSPINIQNMFYVLPAPISVQINGSGTISPNYNGQMLDIGNSYSMTATPSAGVTFTGWTGSLTTSSSTIQFVMASNLLLQANFVDAQKPTNSITTPTSGQLWSNGVFTVTGKASDNVAVSNVWYSLNNAAWTNPATVNNWSNWTATVSLIAGTNKIQSYAMDTSGNISATNSVSFNAILSTVLTVSTNGLGSLNPNYNNALLQVGKSYSITATAGTGFTFTNWTGGVSLPLAVLTNKATLQFVMQSNLVLQANFVDTSKPTLKISSPTSGQKMTNALATLIGTASDNWKVSGVWNQLNGGAWNLANTTNSFTNWTTTLTLLVGTNTVKSYALDLGGNFSLTNTLSLVSSNTFMLQLTFKNTPLMQTNGLVFYLQLSTGLNGHIQVSTNLTSWASLTNFVGTNSTITFRDPAATNLAQRFYRAVIP
jgi:Divergent InlB B-repeat domain/Bacterial Ig domain